MASAVDLSLDFPGSNAVGREKRLRLAALAKDVLSESGREYVRIDDDTTSVVVFRKPVVRAVQSWSDDYPQEYAAELERRLATIDESELLFEVTIPDAPPAGLPQEST